MSNTWKKFRDQCDHRSWGQIVLFGFSSLTVILTLHLYVYVVSIKTQLTQVLHTPFSEDRVPLIYSTPITVRKNMTLCPDSIISHLTEQGYKEVEGRPKQGEFHFQQAGLRLKVHTRLTGQNGAIAFQKNAKSECKVVSFSDHHEEFKLDPVLLGEGLAKSYRSAHRVPRSALPQNLVNAVIAIEDQRFYHHRGIDPIGIFRAVSENIMAGSVVQGGSTLTQQLVKNLSNDRRRTFSRKFREALNALLIEQILTKDEILELYLNKVYFVQSGDIAYHGVPEASRKIFGKEVSAITLSESALLAGLLRAPTLYHPFRNPQLGKARRNLVLKAMQEQNFISKEEYEVASSAPLAISRSALQVMDQEFFLREVRQTLELLPERVGGTVVTTTLHTLHSRNVEPKLSEEQLKLLLEGVNLVWLRSIRRPVKFRHGWEEINFPIVNLITYGRVFDRLDLPLNPLFISLQLKTLLRPAILFCLPRLFGMVLCR